MDPRSFEICTLKSRDFLRVPDFPFESYSQSKNSKITKVTQKLPKY